MPSYIGSFPSPSASLNARMTVWNGMLFLCEYAANKVAIFSLRDRRNPALIGSVTTEINPRDVTIVESLMIVACTGGNKLQIFDITNPSAPLLVGTVTTPAQPKQITAVGRTLYVVCAGANLLKKFSIDRISPLSVSDKGGVSVASSPLCSAYNGNGYLAVTGLSAEIALIRADTLAKTTHTITGETFPTCAFKSADTLIVSGSTLGKVYMLDAGNPASVSVFSSVSVASPPEQVLLSGDFAYAPQLSNSASHLNLLATESGVTLTASIPLTSVGAGFVTQYRDVLYVSGHFAPYVIDMIEVEDGGEEPEMPEMPTLPETHSNRRSYRTITSNSTSTLDDDVIRVGAGASITLHNPATSDGQVITIVNVHASSSSTIINPYAGYSTTLAPLKATTVMAGTFSGTAQWDGLSNL